MDWHWDDHEHQALDERVVQSCASTGPVRVSLVIVPLAIAPVAVRRPRFAANAPRFLFAQPHAPPLAA